MTALSKKAKRYLHRIKESENYLQRIKERNLEFIGNKVYGVTDQVKTHLASGEQATLEKNGNVAEITQQNDPNSFAAAKFVYDNLRNKGRLGDISSEFNTKVAPDVTFNGDMSVATITPDKGDLRSQYKMDMHTGRLSTSGANKMSESSGYTKLIGVDIIDFLESEFDTYTEIGEGEYEATVDGGDIDTAELLRVANHMYGLDLDIEEIDDEEGFKTFSIIG